MASMLGDATIDSGNAIKNMMPSIYDPFKAQSPKP